MCTIIKSLSVASNCTRFQSILFSLFALHFPRIKPAALVPAETSELSAKKKRRRRREMIADLDWWSKYYASLEDDDEVG